MKIAMIIEGWKSKWGRGQIVTYEIGKKLSENYNVKIDLFVMNLVGYKGDKIEYVNRNFRVIYVGKKRMLCFRDRIIWMYELMKEILNYHKKEKYNLIYAHTNLPGFPAKLLSKVLKIPIVYHVHGANNLEIGKKNLFRYVEKFLLTQIRYDLEITVSRKFLNYDDNVNNVVYVPNGVDLKRFDRIYYETKHEKNEDEFKILFVGRFEQVKGLDILILAISKIKEHLINANARIYFIGYGSEENNLKKIVNDLDLDCLVKFKEPLFGNNLIEEYITSDLFILPSLSEGFPLTVLEAWACKLPVLTTSVGELPYIIKDDYNGWLVNPNNPNELAEKLKYILNLDKNKLSKIGKNGYNIVKEKYNWDIIIEKIYNELIKLTKQ